MRSSAVVSVWSSGWRYCSAGRRQQSGHECELPVSDGSVGRSGPIRTTVRPPPCVCSPSYRWQSRRCACAAGGPGRDGRPWRLSRRHARARRVRGRAARAVPQRSPLAVLLLPPPPPPCPRAPPSLASATAPAAHPAAPLTRARPVCERAAPASRVAQPHWERGGGAAPTETPVTRNTHACTRARVARAPPPGPPPRHPHPHTPPARARARAAFSWRAVLRTHLIDPCPKYGVFAAGFASAPSLGEVQGERPRGHRARAPRPTPRLPPPTPPRVAPPRRRGAPAIGGGAWSHGAGRSPPARSPPLERTRGRDASAGARGAAGAGDEVRGGVVGVRGGTPPARAGRRARADGRAPCRARARGGRAASRPRRRVPAARGAALARRATRDRSPDAGAAHRRRATTMRAAPTCRCNRRRQRRPRSCGAPRHPADGWAGGEARGVRQGALAQHAQQVGLVGPRTMAWPC